MAFKDIGDAINSGQAIVIGIIVIAVTVAIGYYIVFELNNTSGGALSQAVNLVTGALGPIRGGITFLALAFLVMVAVVIIQFIKRAGQA